MRFKINYGGKPTYDSKNFSRGKFECKAVFRTKKGMPVVVSHSTDPAYDYWKVAGIFALYLEELVPKLYRLIAREEHTIQQASAYSIHCPICGAVMRAISRPVDKHRLSLYECPECR